MIRVESIQPHNITEWNSVVAESGLGTIFHCTDWLELSGFSFADSSDHVSRKMIMLAEDDETKGLIAGFELGALGFKVLVSPAPRTFTPYGGLILRDHLEASVCLKSLLREYAIVIMTDPPVLNPRKLSEYYFTKNTIVLPDLTIPVEDLWARIRKGTRWSIKKAERSGVSIVEASNESHVECYYDLLKETHERKNISGLLPPSYYLDVFRSLGRSNQAKLLLALYGGEPVAGVFLLNDKKRMYYWSGASTQAGLALGANSMIQWRAILWGKQTGLREYDMIGANVPGVAFFKAGFGGELRKYCRFVIARRPLVGSFVHKYLQLLGF